MGNAPAVGVNKQQQQGAGGGGQMELIKMISVKWILLALFSNSLPLKRLMSNPEVMTHTKKRTITFG